MIKFFVAMTIALSLGLASAQASDGPLKSTLNAHVVTVDEAGTETLIETEDVAPGDTIEYTLIYENTSDRALSDVIVSAPIPAASTYIFDSASVIDGASFEASADDGASWATPPLMMAGEEGLVEIPADAYDFLRWGPSTAIEAGEVWTFSYRVAVN